MFYGLLLWQIRTSFIYSGVGSAKTPKLTNSLYQIEILYSHSFIYQENNNLFLIRMTSVKEKWQCLAIACKQLNSQLLEHCGYYPCTIKLSLSVITIRSCIKPFFWKLWANILIVAWQSMVTIIHIDKELPWIACLCCSMTEVLFMCHIDTCDWI